MGDLHPVHTCDRTPPFAKPPMPCALGYQPPELFPAKIESMPERPVPSLYFSFELRLWPPKLKLRFWAE